MIYFTHKIFLQACRDGCENEVRRLIDSGVDINEKDEYGYRMNGLHFASSNGHENIIPILIEAGIDINAKDSNGRNALHYASEYGHENIIPIFIEAGFDINAEDYYGRNALHYASRNGHENIIPILIEAGIFINGKARNGMNGLHFASSNGHENVIPILIEAGIDINAKDNDGWNGLHWASRERHENIIPILIEAGIDINAKDNDGWNGLHSALNEFLEKVFGSDSDSEDSYDESELHKIIAVLIESGIDINAKDNDGSNALNIALELDNENIARIFLDAGCALSEEDLEIDIVQCILEANLKEREATEDVMAEIDFPRRAAGCMFDFDFLPIRNIILGFIFLPPRES